MGNVVDVFVTYKTVENEKISKLISNNVSYNTIIKNILTINTSIPVGIAKLGPNPSSIGAELALF